jgi:hypothetical protein
MARYFVGDLQTGGEKPEANRSTRRYPRKDSKRSLNHGNGPAPKQGPLFGSTMD